MGAFLEELSITSNMFADEKEVLFHDKMRHIFVMNNHRWAFYCWQKFFKKDGTKKITIAHIDMHPDASFISEKETENGKTNYDDIKNNPDLAYIVNKYLSWDNFIDTFALKNNYNIKVISLVHENEIENGFAKDKEKFEVATFSNKKEHEFFEYLEKENVDILDIDLDYFLDINATRDVFTPWSEEKIDNFFLNLFNKIKYPKIITIATSPSCMGTEFGKDELAEKSSYIYKIIEKNCINSVTQKDTDKF